MFKKALLAVSLGLVLSLVGCGGGGGSDNSGGTGGTGGTGGNTDYTESVKRDIEGFWLYCRFDSTYSAYRGTLVQFTKESGLLDGYNGEIIVVSRLGLNSQCIPPQGEIWAELYRGSYKINTHTLTVNGADAVKTLLKDTYSDDIGERILGIHSNQLYFEKLRSDGSRTNELNYDESYIKINQASYGLYGIR